jgi:hypothetical protein
MGNCPTGQIQRARTTSDLHGTGKLRVEYVPGSKLTDCCAGDASVIDEVKGEEFHLRPGTRMIMPIESTVVWTGLATGDHRKFRRAIWILDMTLS